MKARIVFLILCYIWGSTWLFIKLGLRDLPPITFAAARFLLASSILFVIIKVRGVALPRGRGDWSLLAKTGVLAFTLNYGLLFWGEQHISSGLAALLQATIPAFGMLIAHAYLPGERLDARKMAGVLLGVVGVGVIFSNQLGAEGTHALAGSVAIVVGAACVAWANVLVKAKGSKLDPAVLAMGQMVCGLVPLACFALAFEGNPLRMRWTALAVVCLLYLTLVGSVAAFLLYYWLVRKVDVTKTMLIALVTPLAAVLLGMVTLDEKLTWRVVAGGALIMSGVALVVLWRSRAVVKVEQADATASTARE
ncbi:MAG TPA: EamA family transporter [Pyrinomonadaceae bacterium]|jgi:drug/metabolite transporter (DMT)-like permease|nr:EamA family transporter [Pyrinomonadaceae bacterium]